MKLKFLYTLSFAFALSFSMTAKATTSDLLAVDTTCITSAAPVSAQSKTICFLEAMPLLNTNAIGTLKSTEIGVWSAVSPATISANGQTGNLTVGSNIFKYTISSTLAGCGPSVGTVTINVNDKPTLGTVLSLRQCEGTNVTFTAYGFTGAVNYSWKVTNLGTSDTTKIGQSGQNVNYMFGSKTLASVASDNVTIGVSASNKCGVTNGSLVYTFDLRPRNTRVIPYGPIQICASDGDTKPYTVTPSPSIPTRTTYNWSWGDSVVTTSNANFGLKGSSYINKLGAVKLKVWLSNTCGVSKPSDKAADSIYVTVKQSSKLGIFIEPLVTDKVCVSTGGSNSYIAISNSNKLSGNEIYTFTITDTLGMIRQTVWQNASQMTQPNVFNITELQDGDSVSVKLLDPMSCFNSPRTALSNKIVVDGYFYPRSTIVSVKGRSRICEDDIIVLQVPYTTNRAGHTNDAGVKWFRDGVYLPQYDTTQNFAIALGDPSKSGRYTVKVEGSFCPDSISRDSLYIRVYEKPEFFFTVDPMIINYQEGNVQPMPVVYSKLTPDTSTTVKARWISDFGNYENWLLSKDSLYPKIKTEKEQVEFNYTLTVTTGNRDTAYCATSQQIRVINNIPTTQGIDKNSTFLQGTIAIFPNPTKDFLNLKMDEFIKDTQFELLDVSGNSILKQTLNNQQTQIDISKLNIGSYIYRISSGEKSIYGKVMKE